MDSAHRTYEQLFHSLPTPAFVLDMDARIVESNTAAAELFGGSVARTPLGAALTAWMPAPQRPLLIAVLRRAIAEHGRSELTFEVTGEPLREVRAVVAPVDLRGERKAALLLAVEVSQEVLLQRKFMDADRLSLLGALVSGVAHELKNPLAAIAALGEVLARRAAEPQLRDSARIVHEEATRAGRIVQTLLDFARQRPHQTQPVDLADVVEGVIALQRSALKRARISVNAVMPPDLPAVHGDPQDLQQVLLNAVVNAQQAIADTGRPGGISIHASANDRHVLLSVDDTGPGIPPEVLERAFDPFFTTKGDAGTGLGLPISLGLVKATGGRMWLQNVEQGGARLAVELPAAAARADLPPRAGFQPSARRLRVFVVDDDPAVRRGMVLMAECLGHAVVEAGSFDEAMARLESGEPRYDALLIDVHLDEAHTGFELLTRLREEGTGRERHVVFTTGDSISLHARDRLEQSGRPLLRKPFSLDELREVLERAAEK